MIIKTTTIHDGFIRGLNFIKSKGNIVYDNNIQLKEILNLTFIIELEKFKEPKIENEMHQWMNNNFDECKRIPELSNCKSYGCRLYNYKGVNQIQWIINKLLANPESKSATITMLKRAGSEKYIPCVSLFDFKIRNNKLRITVTCRSLDFGKKALYNFYNIARLGLKVASSLQLKKMKLIIYIISAHIYEDDF